jgi:hypothetical protein
MARAALSFLILVLAGSEASAQSQAARKAARELMDFLRSRFAREVAEEGAERLERRFATVLDRYGNDAALAARKVGPKIALHAVTQYESLGARVLAKWGDKGARLLATEGPAARRVFQALGDDGIALMIGKHGTLTAARLPELAPAIASSGRGRDVLAVLERYGDRACAFIWKNKGVIFGTAALAAFLANPAPYLDGLKNIAEVPIGHIAAATDWTAVFLVATALAAGLAAFRMLILRRSQPVAKPATSD